MPEHYIEYIKDSGINIVSIANNHINDFGIIGINNTVKILNEHNIHFAGIDNIEYTIFNKDDVIYGFCAASCFIKTVNMNNYTKLTRIISELKKKVNIVIFSFHGGAEGNSHSHITKKK